MFSYSVLLKSLPMKMTPKFKQIPMAILIRRCSTPTSVKPQAASHFKTFPGKTVTPIPGQPIINPDGLTRYPSLSSPNGVLRTMDWIGTLAFATSGTITAGYAGMDLLGCTIVGTITSIGGGTVRDILLGQTPVFWMLEVEYIIMCMIASIATFYTWKEIEDNGDGIITENGRFMFWTDTIGVGAFCVIGAQNGIRCGMHPLISVLCGMFTATFGGLIRDVLCKRPVRILHSNAEIYATTALMGASSYVFTRALGGSPLIRIVSGVLVSMSARYAADKYNIKLPLANWNTQVKNDSTKP